MDSARELPRVLRATYFAMHRVSDAHFARYGATADQFVLLACPTEDDGISQQELARRASSDPSTIRAMLVPLEGRELVTRERDPEDNRARLVTLSSEGRRTFERLLKASEPFREQILKGFSPEAARSLIVGLRRVADNIAAGSTLLPEAAHVVPGRRSEKTKLSP